jgi:hypothetical protein
LISGGNYVVAAVIAGLWLWQNDKSARPECGVLAANYDIGGANDVDTVARTTAINNHLEATLPGGEPGDLDLGADDVCSRGEDAPGRDGISDDRRGGWITQVGSDHAEINVCAINPFTGNYYFGGTLNVITVRGLAEGRKRGAEPEQSN